MEINGVLPLKQIKKRVQRNTENSSNACGTLPVVYKSRATQIRNNRLVYLMVERRDLVLYITHTLSLSVCVTD